MPRYSSDIFGGAAASVANSHACVKSESRGKFTACGYSIVFAGIGLSDCTKRASSAERGKLHGRCNLKLRSVAARRHLAANRMITAFQPFRDAADLRYWRLAVPAGWRTVGRWITTAAQANKTR